MSGTYRHIVARANNLCWKVVKYNNSAEDLITSDYDDMQGKLPPGELKGTSKYLMLYCHLFSSIFETFI